MCSTQGFQLSGCFISHHLLPTGHGEGRWPTISRCLTRIKWAVVSTHLVAGHSGSREGNDDPSKLVSDLAEDLAAAGDEVAVVLRVHGHRLLHDIVLQSRESWLLMLHEVLL